MNKPDKSKRPRWSSPLAGATCLFLHALRSAPNPVIEWGTYAEAVPVSGPHLDPRPVEFRSALADLGTPTVVECAGLDPIVVLEIDQRKVRLSGQRGAASGNSLVKITTMGREDPRTVEVPAHMELGDFAAVHLAEKPVRAFSLPPGRVETKFDLRLSLVRAAVPLISLSMIPFIISFVQTDTLRALLVAVAVSLAVASFAIRSRRFRLSRHVFRTEDGQWAFSRLLDERPSLEVANTVVEAIKEEYGRLLSDIVERIEHPALFDPAVETTRRFTSSLIQWDQGETTLGAAQRSTLAARVRLTFDAAKAHAEVVGMCHLPDEARGPAVRAAKSLRLANSTGNPHERETALRLGMEILDSLMLYYLPRSSQVRAMIEGRAQLALPGRHSSKTQEER